MLFVLVQWLCRKKPYHKTMVWVQAEPLGHRPRQAQLLPGGEPGLPQG